MVWRSVAWIVVFLGMLCVGTWAWRMAKDNDRLRSNQQALIEGVT